MPLTQPGTSELSILIVEDDALVRSMVADHLRSRGVRVTQAKDGFEALELLSDSSYDLILTDIVMPRMDGIEMLRRLRLRLPDQAVMIMTSSHDVAHSIEAMRLGAADYILKPMDLQDLETRITLSYMKLETRRREKIQQFQLVEKVLEQEKRLENNFLDSVRSLIHAIEARDRYTKGHSLRVTRLTDLLLRKLGIESDLMSDIILASQLHDTGKLGISDAILNKPDKLTNSEFDIMKTHPEVGTYILRPILPEGSLLSILHHHERWDGAGYPHGLSAEQIPLGARIIALADAFDAMVTDRTYRRAMEMDDVLAEIDNLAGSQFDPVLVSSFLEIIQKNNPMEL
ncbi:MAG: response regulator [bacterium]|nr:response regulator [bacterium]MDT8395302.1 response regulator [bacterium]